MKPNCSRRINLYPISQPLLLDVVLKHAFARWRAADIAQADKQNTLGPTHMDSLKISIKKRRVTNKHDLSPKSFKHASNLLTRFYFGGQDRQPTRCLACCRRLKCFQLTLEQFRRHEVHPLLQSRGHAFF